IPLSQAGFHVRFDLVQAGGRSKCCRLVAVVDCNIRTPARQHVPKTAPIMPGGVAARVADLIDKRTNLIESLNVVGVLSQSKLAITLLDDGVDAAQSVG